MELLLHPTTKRALEQATSHGLLLTGDYGAGKYAAASWLAARLLGLESLENAPYYLRVVDTEKALGIEQVRDLQRFMQLKTTGQGTIRRVVVVEGADTLTTEAQNALLKTLEEPPADSVIILTASESQKLKPTILSRVQTIQLIPPDKTSAEQHFTTQGHAAADVARAYSISNGQMGLLSALLTDQEHPLADQIALAKQLYGMKPFERLTKVDELSKQKDSLSGLLYACKRICTSALENAATKQKLPEVKTWHRQLKLIIDAERQLQRNANTKLLLTDLFLHM